MKWCLGADRTLTVLLLFNPIQSSNAANLFDQGIQVLCAFYQLRYARFTIQVRDITSVYSDGLKGIKGTLRGRLSSAGLLSSYSSLVIKVLVGKLQTQISICKGC